MGLILFHAACTKYIETWQKNTMDHWTISGTFHSYIFSSAVRPQVAPKTTQKTSYLRIAKNPKNALKLKFLSFANFLPILCPPRLHPPADLDRLFFSLPRNLKCSLEIVPFSGNHQYGLLFLLFRKVDGSVQSIWDLNGSNPNIGHFFHMEAARRTIPKNCLSWVHAPRIKPKVPNQNNLGHLDNRQTSPHESHPLKAQPSPLERHLQRTTSNRIPRRWVQVEDLVKKDASLAFRWSECVSSKVLPAESQCQLVN